MQVSWSADGPVDERRRHAGIHAAAQPENHVLLADLRADFFHRLVDVVAHRPVLAAAADPVDEIGQDLASARRVDDLGMELESEEPLLAILDGGVVGVVGRRHHGKALGQAREFVAMRVPDLQGGGQSLEQGAALVQHAQGALAVFPLLAALDLAAQELRQQLHAETDAQDRHAPV